MLNIVARIYEAVYYQSGCQLLLSILYAVVMLGRVITL